MLRLDEILDALKLARAVGQIPFGHFDHDADCAIGPRIPAQRDRSPEKPRRNGVSSAPTKRVKYERFEDPRTGEPLYRPCPTE